MSWSSALNISNTASASNAPDIVTGAGGDLLVVWTDSTGWPIHPMYAWHDGASWDASANVSSLMPDRGEYPNAARHGSGFCSGWVQRTDAGTRDVWFAEFNGGSWTKPVSLSNGGQNWFGSCGGGIAVDKSGTVHVVFDESSAGKLHYVYR